MHYDSNCLVNLIGLAYQGTTEAQPWFAFVDKLAETLDAHDASLIIYSRHLRRFNYHVTSDRHFYWTQQRLQATIDVSYIMELSAPTPLTEMEWGPTSGYFESRLFREFLAPIGIAHILMMDVHSDDEQIVRVVVTGNKKRKPFADDERAILNALAPHIKQAFDIRERLRNTRLMSERSLEIIGKLNVGCLMIDSGRRIVGGNQPARAFIAADARLSIKNDVLLVDDSEANPLSSAITAAIAAARSTDGAGFNAAIDWKSGGGDTIELIVKSIAGKAVVESEKQAVAMLLFQSSIAPFDDREEALLREKHGLSKSEAAIAILLAHGHTLEEVATQRGISLNTVKTHLRSMYAKLGVHRRSQLTALLTTTTNKLR